MASSTSNSKAGQGKAVTPPKGRPTRSRDGVAAERRVFGPTAQWITLAIVIAVVVVIIIAVTGGGEFGPLHGGNTGTALFGALSALPLLA